MLSQCFVDLQSQLASFQRKITDWAKKTDIGELERAIEEITTEIKLTEDAIKKYANHQRLAILPTK